MSDIPALDPLDLPLRGAREIGEAAVMFKDDGTVDISRVYYHLENGLLDATKRGGTWETTTRRIRRQFMREIA
jgi:hypothetical protein